MIAFDDGPFDQTTGRILDILAAAEARALFFVVGDRVRGRERLLERIVAEGHELGNHTQTHARLDVLPLDRVQWEIAACVDELELVTGSRPTAFRPPYLAHTHEVLAVAAAQGHSRLLLESSVGDYLVDAPAIAAEARGRAFVGLHDGLEETVHALPQILSRMQLDPVLHRALAPVPA